MTYEESIASASERAGYDLTSQLLYIQPEDIASFESPGTRKVNSIARALKPYREAGVDWPEKMPLIVIGIRDEDRPIVLDGHHRLGASEKVGYERIPVIAIQESSFDFIRNITDSREETFSVFGARSLLMKKNNDMRFMWTLESLKKPRR